MIKIARMAAMVLIAYGVATCVILRSIDVHLYAIARSLDSIDEHLDTMDTNLDNAERSLSSIDGHLDTMDTNLADK
jgi:hypothetical protein